MSLKEKFLRVLGPSFFAGVGAGDWLKVLAENRFAISPAYWPRAAAIFGYGIANSLVRWPETWIYDRRIRSTKVEAPLIVLGHYRSGTTHLQNLLSIDNRFGHPNFFEVSFPHTFLTAEGWGGRIFEKFAPNRRVMDNVRQAFNAPNEDEWALCVMAGLSPYIGYAFPQQHERYERYLTLHDVSAKEIELWKQTLMYFCQKLTFKYQRPLVIKSPAHTSRVKLLLEMFPEARFVHIHRDPYTVFQSTRHLWSSISPYVRLQHVPANDDLEGRILRQYRDMYDSYLDERSLIPEGRLHELSFADLEQDPVGEVRKIYETLALPEFSGVESELQQYVRNLAGYKKNRHTDLAPGLRRRIAQEWSRTFEEWGYPTEVESPRTVASPVST